MSTHSSPRALPSRPEVLAPAGDEHSLRAALAAGANAVYLGLSDGFNARAKAKGVALSELARVVRLCHEANAKLYLTLNTLLFESELSDLEAALIEVARAGVDALIVQDPAVALLARELSPRLEVHASTQMTISSPEGAEFAQGLGVTRVVVPRELSLSEVQRFAERTPLELEVFIHGALCMSWSGQCLTSEAWGGRSANRGQCAQSCRMPYELVVDGETRPLGEVSYLLSPSDLAGFRALEGLWDAGVASLKIEGRYKGPAYVQQSVSAYQRWLDRLERGEQSSTEATEALQRDLTDLSLVYSRGLTDGFLGGSDHQQLVEGRFPKHRGVYLGRVQRVEGASVWVSVDGTDGRVHSGGLGRTQADEGAEQSRSQRALSLRGGTSERSERLPSLGGDGALTRLPLAPLEPVPGMGVVFDAGRPESDEVGGRLFAVEALAHQQGQPTRWRLEFASAEQVSAVREGERVWVNNAPALIKRAERDASQPALGRLPLVVEVSGAEGEPLSARATLTASPLNSKLSAPLSAEAQSEAPLSVATRGGIDEELIKSKLCAFGQTPFHVQELRCELPEGLHLPVSALKALRRSLIEQLTEALEQARPHPVLTTHALPQLHTSLAERVAQLPSIKTPHTQTSQQSPQLIPLCRTMEQLEAVIGAGLKEVELDWMEFVGLRAAVERARAFGLKVHIATVRVQKPGEQGYDKRIEQLNPDGVLVRHWGGLTHFAALKKARQASGEPMPELHGDFSLNLTNSLSARYVLAQGLDTVTASHDLDVTQLNAMLAHLPAERLTVTLHHHIPTFHTEHCVYAHLLSEGADFRSCGRPCESHRVALRDHKGQEHPVIVDVECRNTVFNAAAQSALTLVKGLKESGVGRLRVEFVWETREQATRVLEGYQGLLSGTLSEAEVSRLVSAHEQFGLSSGTMTLYERPLTPSLQD